MQRLAPSVIYAQLHIRTSDSFSATFGSTCHANLPSNLPADWALYHSLLLAVCCCLLMLLPVCCLLQSGTSHNLGDNFARAFNTQFTDEQGQLQ